MEIIWKPISTGESSIPIFLTIYESAYAITLQNAEDQDVEVTVEENLPGDWEILSESLPHNKVNATTVSWKVNVGAKGSSVLQYRLRSVMQ